jgi:hypothetical protein
VQDPDYLTEPLIHTTNYTQELQKEIPPWKCEIVTELVGQPEGFVPHYYPWKNPYAEEFSEKYGIPRKAALGGAGTMYPSYLENSRE